MKFNHVAHHALTHKRELLRAVEKVLTSGIFLEGPAVKKLQQQLSSFLGGGYVTTVTSGHDALVIALASLQLQAGDEVIVPVNAYPSAFPVVQAGLKPIFVDSDSNGQLDPEKLRQKITKKTKAIIVVHMYGLVGELSQISKIAKTHHIPLIEDCAQAFGSKYRGKYVGTWGDIGTFSFYPTKNLGTLGDGGALWTKSTRRNRFFQQAKSYGELKKYHSRFTSFHSRMPEIQAAIASTYFKTIRGDFAQKKRLTKYFLNRLATPSLAQKIIPYLSTPDSQPVQHLLVIKAEKRDQLRRFLAKNQIETIIHYPVPLHQVPAFAPFVNRAESFPTAEMLAKKKVSLPFHQYLTKKEIDKIIHLLETFYAQ